ncbi:MAG: serine protease, partial [Pseudomonas sp.]|nr:serine protease [Pseudomonas sp.]
MKNTLATVKCCTLGVLLLSQTLHAGDLGEGLANQSNSRLLKNNDNTYNHWNGIGKIFKNNQPRCTASLIDTRDEENNALGPAYVLTAGHCVSLYLVRPVAALPFEASVTFNFFNDTPDEYKSYKIHNANWASLTGTDIAIL